METTERVETTDRDIEQDIISFFEGLDKKSKVAIRLAQSIAVAEGGDGPLSDKLEAAIEPGELTDPTLARMYGAAEALDLAGRLS